MAGLGLNKILLIGNLTKDPELRYLPNGTPKAELRLASSRTYTTNGERREDTCFVDVVAWSRTAENCNQFLKKGSKVFVEGRLDYQEWEGQDGSKRSKHQVVADRVQFLDSRNAGSDAEGGASQQEGGYAPRAQRSYASSGSGPQGGPNAQNGRGYGPRPYGNAPATGPESGAPAPAPIGAPSQQAETGLEPRPAGSMGEAMGIADDDIPF